MANAREMRFGLIPAGGGAIDCSGTFIADYMGTADEAGFESVWVGEHPALPANPEEAYPGSGEGLAAPSSNPLPDPFEWLAYASAQSKTMKIGTDVVIGPLHSPVVLAKRCATLDQVSGGRFILGIGVGWNRQEYVACGARFEHRGSQLDEMIEAMRTLWHDEISRYEGKFYQFEPLYSSPKPVNGTVPVFVGASAPPGARRAGRLGDGFMPFARDPEKLVEQIDEMKRSAEQAGRDPSKIELMTLGSVKPERIKWFASLGITRLCFFNDKIASLPELGKRLQDAAASL